MRQLLSIFRKKTKPDAPPFTKEQAVAFLQTCGEGCFIIPAGYYDKTVEFLKRQLIAIDIQEIEVIRRKSTKPTNLVVIGHPEFIIRDFDHDLFNVNLILASLPPDIEKVSRQFVRHAISQTDIAVLIERVNYLMSHPQHVNCRCAVKFTQNGEDEKNT